MLYLRSKLDIIKYFMSLSTRCDFFLPKCTKYIFIFSTKCYKLW